MAITLNGTTGITTPGTDSTVLTVNTNNISAVNSLGFRNRIINGDMRIDQRNAGASVTPGAGVTYPIDRFNLTAQQASKFTFQQVADAPVGFKNSTKITVAAQYSPAAGDVFYFSQPIEGNNVSDLGFGTASALTVTLSLWIKGSVAGTYAASLLNNSLNRSYIGNITVTTSWAFQTVTFVGDTSGTWATDNSCGIALNIDLGSGSTFQSTTGSWLAGRFYRTSSNVTFVNQANGSTLNITGVQLEAGSVASPFERRDYGRELMMCQRYAVTYNSDDSNTANRMALGIAAGSTRAYCMVKHPVSMRAKASVTVTGVTALSDTTAGAITTAISVQTVTSDINQTNLDITVTSGLTSFRPYYFEFSGTSGKLTLSAEL